MRIFILAGGHDGTQYAKRLSLARERGKIKFDELIVIDRASKWVDFLVDYIKGSPKDTPDLIVPSHAAPHILGKVFKRLINGVIARSETTKQSHPINTPFEKELEKGVIAASFATWKCPANCTEPKICPHTRKLRTWNLEKTFKNWAVASKIDLFYVFPAHHLVSQVSAIPAQMVIDAWCSLKAKLRKGEKFTVGVATSSACHGIVTLFRL